MSKPCLAPFTSIDPMQLDEVVGGATRVSARRGSADDQLTMMLTQVTSSIRDLGRDQGSRGLEQMVALLKRSRNSTSSSKVQENRERSGTSQ